MNPIGRKKRMVYVGRRGWIDRLGVRFERYVPLDVDLLTARKLVMAYPLDYEMVWEGAPDVPARGSVAEAQADTADVPAPDVVVEQVVAEEDAPKKPAPTRGRPKKVAVS